MATIDKLFDTIKEALASKERDMAESKQVAAATGDQANRLTTAREKLEKAQELRQQFNAAMADILTQADLLAHATQKFIETQHGYLVERQEFLADDIDRLADMVTLLTPGNFIYVIGANPQFAIELFSHITNDPTLTEQAVTRLTDEQMQTLRQHIIHDAKRRWGDEGGSG